MPEFSLIDAMAGMSKTDMGELLPDGLYPMEAVEVNYLQSTKKGTPGWRYKAVITDGEFKDETLEGTAWFSKTKGGLALFWQQMRALGITVEWMNAVKPSNDQIAEAATHAKFMGNVGTERPEPGQQGRTRNRLIAETPLDDGGGGGDQSTPEPEYDEGGDVLVDDLFAGTEEAAPDAAADDPGADDGSAPGPDGSAGEAAEPLPEAEAALPAADEEDDPWK